MNYSEKLKDPRWQKKRLEIFERDKFTCRGCGDSKKTLSVHHLIYTKNTEPWDYLNELLYTLCNECHEFIKDVDFAKEITLYVFNNPNIKCLKRISEDPVIWIFEFANAGYKSFSEAYNEYLDWCKWMKKHRNE